MTANAAEFVAASVTNALGDREGRVDPKSRRALTIEGLGPFEPMLRRVFDDALPEIVAQTGTTLSQPSFEFSFAAHGDGAFFAPHLDVSIGQKREPVSDVPGQDRILSAVYYFHRDPKAFSGGALRLFRFGANPYDARLDEEQHIDLEPIDNSLVAFPSTVFHEVRPVRCPTTDFADYRFSLNCWYCRTL